MSEPIAVFLSLSFHRNEPRWDGEGMAEFATFIDGIGATAARQYGKTIGMHRGAGDRHFHVVRWEQVRAKLNRYGQPE